MGYVRIIPLDLFKMLRNSKDIFPNGGLYWFTMVQSVENQLKEIQVYPIVGKTIKSSSRQQKVPRTFELSQKLFLAIINLKWQGPKVNSIQ